MAALAGSAISTLGQPNAAPLREQPPGPWFNPGRAERLAIRFNPSGPFDGRSTSDVSAIVSSRQSKCRGE
jgi:hypothetical protein